MMVPSIGELRRRMRRSARFNAVYVALTILALHWALVLYVNSTYLEQFLPTEAVGILFVLGSTITILAFLFISRVLRQLGNFKLTIGLVALEMATLLGLAFAPSLSIAVPLFILHQAAGPLILFNIDVFTEHLIGKKEGKTGGKRGLQLSVMSLAFALAPLGAGALIGAGEPRYTYVYLASAALLVPFWYVITRYFKHFQDPSYTEIKVLSTMRTFWEHRDLRFVFLSHFLLQLFFACMVIYLPLYLATVIGFPWNDIGVLLFVGLMAYVFFEYPIGEVADRWLGEKEMMMGGFIIMAVSTIAIGLLSTAVLIPWMVTLFLTRVGASFVETTTESYFFKQTEDEDANIISFFRTTRPLSYIVGALFSSFLLLYISLNNVFIILGVLLLSGTFSAMMLHDTK